MARLLPIARLVGLILLVVTLATGATGCASWRSLERRGTFMLVSPTAEAEMGSQYAEQIEKEYKLLEDAEAQAWLDRVGAALVAYSPPTEQAFRFALVDSSDVNAFAIPGGFCYVNRGLIEFAENEAQVVAVIGHEINHVTARHGIMRMQRSMGVAGLGAVASLAINDPTARAAAVAATAGGTYVAVQQFSQRDESEADRLGAEAMYQAGWDPREAAKFFDRLRELNESGNPPWLKSFLSSHPTSAKRSAAILKMVEAYDLTVPLKTDSPEFQSIRTRLKAAKKDEAEKDKG